MPVPSFKKGSGRWANYDGTVPKLVRDFRFGHERVIKGEKGSFSFGCYWIFYLREVTIIQCLGGCSHYWFFGVYLSKKKVSFFIGHLSKIFFCQCYIERLIKSVYQNVLNQLSVWKAPTNDSNSKPNFLWGTIPL